jgi:RND family efflux transporter MFP subunit
MKIVRILLAILLLAGVFVAGYGYGRWYGPLKAGAPARNAGEQRYHCPMHPTYISDKPGDCPICGMRLVPLRSGEDRAAAAEPGRKILYYRDPHDHAYTSENPGLNPETGNDLEPVYEGSPESMPPGTVRISAEKQQLIGVRYGTAELTAGVRTVRAVGKVAFDETRISRVHSRTEGWVDRLFVDFTGKLVQKGQPLLTLYSPELLASQQELLLAARAKEVMLTSPLRSAADHSVNLLDAARRRLEQWELSDAQIEQVIETRKPIRNVTLHAPAGGYVLERKVFANQKIGPEMELYTIADLSRVWIMADVFEFEAPLIRHGQPARVSLSYAGGRSFPAHVDYIQPQVDPTTRTLQVRLEVNNPALALKPDMYVDVDFRIALPQNLTVPAEAVLDSGERKTVFVDRGNGFLEPRRVETGGSSGDRIIILSGLQAGERVVTSGNFLIDSESQLKAAAEGMTVGGAAHDHGATSPFAPVPPPAPAQAAPGGGAHQHD